MIVSHNFSYNRVAVQIEQIEVFVVEFINQQVLRLSVVLGSGVYVICDDELAAIGFGAIKVGFEPVDLVLSLGALVCGNVFLIHVECVDRQNRELCIDIDAIVPSVLECVLDC